MQVQQNACILRSFVLSEKWKLKMQSCSVFSFSKMKNENHNNMGISHFHHLLSTHINVC